VSTSWHPESQLENVVASRLGNASRATHTKPFARRWRPTLATPINRSRFSSKALTAMTPNIYAESDVDVVIRLDSIFRYDIERLTKRKSKHTARLFRLRLTILRHSRARSSPSSASVRSRRSFCGQESHQNQERSESQECRCCCLLRIQKFQILQRWAHRRLCPGIIFPTPSGEIINYPKQHSSNLTSQHQATATF